jgi:hypothetical protein
MKLNSQPGGCEAETEADHRRQQSRAQKQNISFIEIAQQQMQLEG